MLQKRFARHLRDYDIGIDQLLAQHPDTRIFTSFPGLAPVTAATLLAGVGEDRSRYPTAGAPLAETGLASVTRASGRSRQVRFRYEANKRMRHSIDWWTFVAVREDPHCSGHLCQEARAAGRCHHRAPRGIGTRWSVFSGAAGRTTWNTTPRSTRTATRPSAPPGTTAPPPRTPTPGQIP